MAFDKNKALKRVEERKRETKVLIDHSFSPPLSAFARSLVFVYYSHHREEMI